MKSPAECVIKQSPVIKSTRRHRFSFLRSRVGLIETMFCVFGICTARTDDNCKRQERVTFVLIEIVKVIERTATSIAKREDNENLEHQGISSTEDHKHGYSSMLSMKDPKIEGD